jgi:adenylate cyclase
VAGRYDEARAPLQRYIGRYPNILGAHLTLAAGYNELGKEAEAHAEATEVLRLNPKFSLEVHKQRAPIKDPAVLNGILRRCVRPGLSNCGLPPDGGGRRNDECGMKIKNEEMG